MDAKYICGIKTIPRRKRNVIDVVILICLWPVFLLSKLIPKNKHLHIYGSSLGWHFADNSKYLFLYVSENVNSINSVFISKNLSVVKHLHENGLKAKYLYSLDGVITVLRAKKAFLSHSTEDIHPVLLGGTEIIQLWHGTPLKKICYDADWESYNGKTRTRNFLRKVSYKLFPYLYSAVTFDKILISSEFVKQSYMSALRISNGAMMILGQPRNDVLDINYILNKKFFPELEYLKLIRDKSKAVISWLPTHRGGDSNNILNLLYNYAFEDDDFEKLLDEFNALFIIKSHFLEMESLKSQMEGKKRIIVYDSVDPYPLLRFTDILITDYSSVYFDFLLLNKPIIFTPFDYDNYQKNGTSFYYDYEEVTPGAKCYNWHQVIEELKSLLQRNDLCDKDYYYKKRIEVRDLFNYHKRDFSKRIVDKILD